MAATRAGATKGASLHESAHPLAYRCHITPILAQTQRRRVRTHARTRKPSSVVVVVCRLSLSVVDCRRRPSSSVVDCRRRPSLSVVVVLTGKCPRIDQNECTKCTKQIPSPATTAEVVSTQEDHGVTYDVGENRRKTSHT